MGNRLAIDEQNQCGISVMLEDSHQVEFSGPIETVEIRCQLESQHSQRKHEAKIQAKAGYGGLMVGSEVFLSWY